MGQGPYGPRPIWARAHMGPGPLGPGPFLVGRTPHQKTHPGKKNPNCVFLVVFWKQKRCAASVRSFWWRYRAEISATCQKTKVFVLGKNPDLGPSPPVNKVRPRHSEMQIKYYRGRVNKEITASPCRGGRGPPIDWRWQLWKIIMFTSLCVPAYARPY